MKKVVFILCCFLLAGWPALAAQTGADKTPIKIGGLFSYTGIPEWMEGAQNAARMAVDEQNAAGGLMGRPVELIVRDDRLDPGSAVQVVQDLVERDGVVALTGVSFSHIALAIGNQSDQMGIPYVASWCWKDDCTARPDGMIFTLDQHPRDTMDDMAVYAGKQPVKRWAILVPAMEYGFTAKKYFEEELKKTNPDAEIVVTREYPYGKADFTQIIRVFQQHKVEGVLNAADSGDLAQYLRASRKLGFDRVVTINPYLPYEGLIPLKNEAPVGWFILSYPGPELKSAAHLAFIDAYRKKFGQTPGLLALLCYIGTKFTLTAIDKAQSTQAGSISAALKGLSVETPVGPVTMDGATRRSDLGYWYGITDTADGKPVLRDFYRSGEKKP